MLLLLNDSRHGNVVLIGAITVDCLLLRNLSIMLTWKMMLRHWDLIVRLHRWKTIITLCKCAGRIIVLICKLLILGLIVINLVHLWLILIHLIRYFRECSWLLPNRVKRILTQRVKASWTRCAHIIHTYKLLLSMSENIT